MNTSGRITSKILYIILCISLIMCTCSCSNTPFNGTSKSGVTQNGVFFDTYISITLYGLPDSKATPILNECLNKCDYYEQLFDNKITGSDTYAINNRTDQTVQVSQDTIHIINTALEYSDKTDGLFDITIYSASKLWDFHDENSQIPAADDLTEAVRHVDYRTLTTDSNNSSINLTDKDTQIDIGGIAKGYIADCLADYIQTTEATGAVINIGGDMMLIGHKPDEALYTIGINNPFGESTPIAAIRVTDMAVATSGTYIRTINHDGQKYHHILNPATGFPCNTDLVSATVITKKSIDADTLCTISILKGSSAAIDFIENIPNTEAILITNDGDMITTSGASDYIIKQ